jgi:hypothetical protein
MANTVYKDIDEWLGEIENFSLRVERIPEEAIPWVKVAWEEATKSARVQQKILETEIEVLKQKLEWRDE